MNKLLNMDNREIKERVLLSTFLHTLENNILIHSVFYVNLRTGNSHGIFSFGRYHVQFNTTMKEEGRKSCFEVVIADHMEKENEIKNNGKKRMVVLTADSVESELVEMDSSGMRENVIIDLNREGRRWEGGELNGKPFGFGFEYSEDDNLVYEGFVFEGMKVCFGKEWNDNGNNNCLMYEGGYFNNERWGKGISYDLGGNTDYEGEWMNNHGMTKNENELKNELIFSITIEELVIDEKMFNDEHITTLHFSPLLIRLKQIKVGNSCFKYVREFIIDGLPNLENVKIGWYCFKIGDKERDDGLFRIMNCSNLHQLEIGNESFFDFQTFELTNVNSLQSIEFGGACLFFANLTIKGKLK